MNISGTRNEGAFDPWMLLSSIKRKACQIGVNYVRGEVVGFTGETSSPESKLNHFKVCVQCFTLFRVLTLK